MFYDVTNRETFNELSSSINYLISVINGVKIYLIGNKIDLNHLKVIETSEINDLSKQNQLNFMEVSCLNGKNVERSFNTFLAHIVTDILTKEVKIG